MSSSSAASAQHIHATSHEFRGKAALVTGTTGIGRAIALRLASAGAQVTACGIDEEANAALGKEGGEAGLPLRTAACDVADPIAVQHVVERVSQAHGGLDILVNTAAVHPFGSVLETEPAAWMQCMAVNVSGVYLMARAVIPLMQTRGGGSIVNLASVQGSACQTGVAAYAASKGAVLSLTRALALDHAGQGIRANSISPGSVRTPMLASAAARLSPDAAREEVFARFGAAHPLGRIGTPEEVAELAAFLASDRSSFITGADFVIDGGLLAAIGVR